MEERGGVSRFLPPPGTLSSLHTREASSRVVRTRRDAVTTDVGDSRPPEAAGRDKACDMQGPALQQLIASAVRDRLLSRRPNLTPR
jgi:hypothetical protein